MRDPHPLMESYDDSGNQAANELWTEVERLRKALYTAIVSPEDDPEALGVVLDHEWGQAFLIGSTEEASDGR